MAYVPAEVEKRLTSVSNNRLTKVSLFSNESKRVLKNEYKQQTKVSSLISESFTSLTRNQRMLGPITEAHLQLFLKNPRFVGLKFPDMSRPETLQKRFVGKVK